MGRMKMTEQELDELNLQVAAIAGWTDIAVWEPERNLPIKTYQGTNNAHPEFGKFVPKYVEDLNAIVLLLESLKIYPAIDFTNDCVYYMGRAEYTFNFSEGFRVALALCKLLIAINPQPISKPEIIEASFG